MARGHVGRGSSGVLREGHSDDGALGHANTVAAVGLGNPDVAFLAPASAPGVPDDPVVCAIVGGAPADHVDSVVNLLRAFGGVEDTTFVVLPGIVASINGDGQNLGAQGLLDLVSIPGVHRAVAHGVCARSFLGVELAFALAALVGVVTLEHGARFVGVEVVNVGLEPTIAAIVASLGAVDELLLRVLLEVILAVLNGLKGLKVSSTGEGPAATAATLVLDRVAVALIAPVDG